MIKYERATLQALCERAELAPWENREARMCLLDASQMDAAFDLAVQAFGSLVPPTSVRPTLRHVSHRLSFGIEADGTLIGAYLIGEHSLQLRGGSFPLLEARVGLQGEALVVHPLARGKGYGRALRATLPKVAEVVGADYVWGAALAELANLNHWLRRRVLVYSGVGLNVTLEPIAADLKAAFLPLAAEHLRERCMSELGIEHEALSGDFEFDKSSC